MNLSLLRFVIALGCPPLAFFSVMFGNRAGLSTEWRGIAAVSLITLGLAVAGKLKPRKNRPTCESHTRGGERCKRTALEGQQFCFQHLQNWRSKLRAIPRSKNLTFYLNAGSTVVTLVSITTTLWFGRPVLTKHAPAAPTGVTAAIQ